MQVGQVAVRGAQLLFTILVTALIGNAIATAFAGNPSAINYSIFVAVFSWVVIIFGLVAAFVSSLAIPVVLLVLDGLAALFTVIAGIVLAARLGVHSCNNSNYTRSNSLTNGSADSAGRCRELQAATAFFWFLFVAYLASIAMTLMSGGTSSIRRGGIRKGGPSMTQV